MNFLGHAYIVKDFPELIAGNFAGDSYKGHLENIIDLDPALFLGVKIHRFIDDVTDHSEHIIQVNQLFRSHGVSRIGFIACDLLLDHYLAKNWNQYSNVTYEKFIQQIYLETEKQIKNLPPDFRMLYSNLKKYGWFFDYPTEKGIRKIANQFSKRLGFENDLLLCFDIYESDKQSIDIHFAAFLTEIMNKCDDFIAQNR